MQIDYFDLDNTADAQKVALPWPLRFAGFNVRGSKIRVYYTPMPGNTEQTGTFYFVKTNQDLPETFPAKLLGTIFGPPVREGELGGIDYTQEDDAVHVFFETPVNDKRKRPHVVKENEGEDNGD